MESAALSTVKLYRMLELGRFTDAHCHLDLFKDPLDTIDIARDAGVGTIITAGSDPHSNLKILEIAKGSVYGVAGISPDFSAHGMSHIDELAELVKMNMNIIGIGEIGLDTTVISKASMEMQRKAFMKQIEIAKALEIPVVIHSRKALKEVMAILEDEEVERAIMHFFEGNEEDAKLAEKRGYLVSIPPGDSSRRRRVIKALDITSIVAETDSPAVGKSPADVVDVIGSIAKLKGISLEDAGESITKTIKEYFYI